MPQSKAVPKNVAAWMAEQVAKMNDLVTEASAISDHGRRDHTQWTLDLLTKLSEVEKVSRRAVHLLTANALRNQLASPTAVAKASEVTISTAQNRNGSALAQEVWEEVTSRRARS